MGCKCASFDESVGRYQCSVSGNECLFLIPSSEACARMYGEGPDADKYEEERRCDMKKENRKTDYPKEDGLQDKVITCTDCGNEFPFTVGEQQFYKEKGFESEPKRCPDCRRARKQRNQQGGGGRYDR